MFEDYKKDLRDLFQKFHDDGVFESLYDQLSHGNHYINVNPSEYQPWYGSIRS